MNSSIIELIESRDDYLSHTELIKIAYESSNIDELLEISCLFTHKNINLTIAWGLAENKNSSNEIIKNILNSSYSKFLSVINRILANKNICKSIKNKALMMAMFHYCDI